MLRRLGCVLGRSASAEPSEFREDVVEAEALDELHHVVVQTVLLADAEDRDDVRVVQPGGGLSLADEPLRVRRVVQQLRRQHLDRDAPTERDLFRLVHDAHPAVPDLAEDAVVAQLSQGRRLRLRRRRVHAFAFDALHHLERGEQVLDPLGEVGMGGNVLRDGRAFAPPAAGCELLGQFVQSSLIGSSFGHGRLVPGVMDSSRPPRPAASSFDGPDGGASFLRGRPMRSRRWPHDPKSFCTTLAAIPCSRQNSWNATSPFVATRSRSRVSSWQAVGVAVGDIDDPRIGHFARIGCATGLSRRDDRTVSGRNGALNRELRTAAAESPEEAADPDRLGNGTGGDSIRVAPTWRA